MEEIDLYAKQMELEKEMTAAGQRSYEKSLLKARESGQESQTAPAQELVSRHIAAVSEGLKEWLADVTTGKAAKHVPFEYEKMTISYVTPATPHKYTPDFLLLANGIIVESKGRFVVADRKKHLLVKARGVGEIEGGWNMDSFTPLPAGQQVIISN